MRDTSGRVFCKRAILLGLLFVVAVIAIAGVLRAAEHQNSFLAMGDSSTVSTFETESPCPSTSPRTEDKPSKKKQSVTSTPDPEQGIYTYLQGPQSWERRREWSGEWGNQYLDGGYFGGFGCGLCCIANLYSSLTPYQCSPLDMYQYAREETYYPGGMAIGWGDMRRTVDSLGFGCKLQKKPETYREFRDQVADSLGCIVLVSSQDSQVFWQDTPGHYVTIFLWEEESGTVFLADSGVPEHNRQRIALKKIYRSLKTASDWQYLQVTDYRKNKDEWKHKKISGDWVKGSTLPAKEE